MPNGTVPISSADVTSRRDRIIRWLLLLCLAALVLIVSGCGGHADSVMEVSDDFAGERRITLTFDRAELNQIRGGFPVVVGIAQANCPPELEIRAIDETKESPTIEFVMSFASFEDYADQLERVLSAGSRAITLDIAFEPPGDMPFVDKFTYHENITHRDLFDWLVRALYRENVVTTRPGVEPVPDESMTVHMRGVDYRLERSSEGFASTESQSFSPETIDVYTGFLEDGNLRRIIQLTLPYDVELANDRLQDWLAEQAGSGIEYRLEEDANGFKTVLTFDFITSDSDGLQLMSGQIFNDPSHLIQRRQLPVEQRTDQLAEYWNESFDLDFFYGRTDDKPQLRRFFDGHYLNAEDSLAANEGRVKSALAYPVLPKDGNHPLVTDRRGEVTLIMDLPLRTLRIDTNISASGQLRREYEMGFEPRWFEHFADTLRKQLPEDVVITKEDPVASTLTLSFTAENGARFANVNYQLLGWESMWYQGQRLLTYNGIITERPGERPILVLEPIAYQVNMPYRGSVELTGLREAGKTETAVPRPQPERYENATTRDAYSVNKAFRESALDKAETAGEEQPRFIGIEPNFNEPRLVLHSFQAADFEIYTDYTGTKWVILLIVGAVVVLLLLLLLLVLIYNRRARKRKELRDFDSDVLYSDEAEQARLKAIFEKGHLRDEEPLTRISWDDEPPEDTRDPFAPPLDEDADSETADDGDEDDY